MQTIRTFVTLKLPEEVLKELAGVQRALQNAGIKGRFTAPTNLHLTLKFLGEVPLNSIGAIQDALDGVAQNYAPFELYLKDFNLLPVSRHPRILYAGLGGDLETLTSLAEAIEASLAPWGFAKEKRVFRPHLTLVRKPEYFDGLETLLQNMPMPSQVKFKTTGIYFYKSVLTPRGPIYSMLRQCPFNTPEKISV